jgi:hypothetical protein
MIDFFLCLLISVLISYGIAIVLVEKGNDFPIKKYRVILQKIIHKYIGWKWAQVLRCSICSGFWITGFVDCFLCIFMFLIFGQFYFFWPFSGFMACGFTWTMIEFLNALDSND